MGVRLLLTQLLEVCVYICLPADVGTDTNNTNSSVCERLSEGDYQKILWTSAAELPGNHNQYSIATVKSH